MANPNPQTTWEESLAPVMRQAAQRYLRSLGQMSVDDASLSATERLLRRQIAQSGYRTLTGREWKKAVLSTLILTLSTGIAIIVLHSSLAATLLLFFGGFLSGFIIRFESRPTASLAAAHTSMISQALPLVAQTRAEKLYVEAALQLLPSENGDTIPDDIRRERMEQLSALFASGKQLETIGEEIRAGLSGQEPGRLRGERANLYERLARTADRETQAALEKSLALCEERIARTEKLLILRGRVEAQCEVVYQAFGAVQGALASMRLSPSLTTSATSDQTAEIAITIGRQTAAVEQAVQEVLALKAGK